MALALRASHFWQYPSGSTCGASRLALRASRFGVPLAVNLPRLALPLRGSRIGRPLGSRLPRLALPLRGSRIGHPLGALVGWGVALYFRIR